MEGEEIFVIAHTLQEYTEYVKLHRLKDGYSAYWINRPDTCKGRNFKVSQLVILGTWDATIPEDKSVMEAVSVALLKMEVLG